MLGQYDLVVLTNPNTGSNVVMCDINILSSIRYRYYNGINVKISIQHMILINCVWVANIYKYASNTKLLHNKPWKLVDKLLKRLNCTKPTFISSVIVQSHTILIEDISIIIAFSINIKIY